MREEVSETKELSSPAHSHADAISNNRFHSYSTAMSAKLYRSAQYGHEQHEKRLCLLFAETRR